MHRLTMYMYSQSSRARRRERERGRPFGATVLTQVPLKGIVGRDVHLLRAHYITPSRIKRQYNVLVPPVDAGDIAPDPLAHHFNPNLYSFISLYYPTNITTTFSFQCRFVWICNGIVARSHVIAMAGSRVVLAEIPCQLDARFCCGIMVRSHVHPINGLVRGCIEIQCHRNGAISSSGIVSRCRLWDWWIGGLAAMVMDPSVGAVL